MEYLERLLDLGSFTKDACQCSAQTHITETEEHDQFERQPPHLFDFTLEYSWAEVQRATDHFSEGNALNHGPTGEVFQGVLEEGLPVAVKVFSSALRTGFTHEIRLLSRCRHPNVVTLLGFAMELDPTMSQGARDHAEEDTLMCRRALIYELLPGGSAHWRLHGPPGPEHFPWHQRLQTALEASRGLAHLHKFRPELHHRNVKSANILFGEDGAARIADFGLACTARCRSDLHLSALAEPHATEGYGSPEFVRNGVMTEASEVYSMGVVLMEFLTGKQPAKKNSDGSVLYLLSEVRPSCGGARELQNLADAAAHWPQFAKTGLAALTLMATHDQPERRPHFLEIVAILQNLQCTAQVGAPGDTGPSDSELSCASGGPREAPGLGDAAQTEGAEANAGVGATASAGARAAAGAAARATAAGAEQLAEKAEHGLAWLSRKWSGPVSDGKSLSDRFDGRWVHKNCTRLEEHIVGDMIYGQDGTVTKVARENDALCIDFDGTQFRAALVGEELFWDDGDIWVRRPPAAAAAVSTGKGAVPLSSNHNHPSEGVEGAAQTRCWTEILEDDDTATKALLGDERFNRLHR